jgi:S1-C subfamily serine protease
LALTVTVIAALFQAVGVRLRRTVARSSSLSALDRGVGSIAGALAVLLVVWFLVPAASEVPGGIARQVRTSVVVDAVATIGPPPPDTVRALRNLVATSRFPEVFADLQPSPVAGPPPEDIPVDPSVVDRATASTVNVETEGCGRRYEGSGWAAADDLIVTNAHVVAGADDVAVRRPDGTVLPATVVVFDADRDLAVLEVPDLGQTPLERAAAEPGDLGVVIGYPGGQDTPRVAPVEIQERRAAVGRDIYGEAQTERRVVFLSSQLQQGDSGSPVVDTGGRVGGVVFAISPDQPTSAFALDLEEVDAVLDAPRAPGETGPCI